MESLAVAILLKDGKPIGGAPCKVFPRFICRERYQYKLVKRTRGPSKHTNLINSPLGRVDRSDISLLLDRDS